MTREQRIDRFFKNNGRTWDYLRGTGVWEDLLDLLRSCDPAREMPDITVQSLTEHSQHLLGRISGFNLAVNILERLERPQTDDTEPETTFRPEEEPL